MEKVAGVQEILQSACQYHGLIQENIRKSAKRILASYQKMRWVVMPFAQGDSDTIYYFCKDDLSNAITWVESFHKGGKDCLFKQHMGVLWESGWMQKSISITMQYLKEFTPDGEVYHKLIQKHYLGERPLTESEMLSVMNMSRSTYYDKLGKAATAFGLLFWKKTIPQMHQLTKAS